MSYSYIIIRVALDDIDPLLRRGLALVRILLVFAPNAISYHSRHRHDSARFVPLEMLKFTKKHYSRRETPSVTKMKDASAEIPRHAAGQRRR